MQIRKNKLQIVRDALSYAVAFGITEEETAEFALLLVEVEVALVDEEGEP